MDGTAFWVAAVIASVLVGMGKGGIPLVGMLGVPVLALVISPVAAAGLLLPVYVVSDMFGLWAYRQAYDRRVLAILLPGAVAGIWVGWATARLVPEAAVTALVGAIGLVFAANLLLRRKGGPMARPARVAPGLFWGAVTGFTSFVSHSGAPPYQIYVQPMRMEPMLYAGTTTIFFAITNAVKLIPYGLLGQLSPHNLRISAVLAVPALLGVWAGLLILKRVPATFFYKFITWALAIVSVKLIWDGL